MAGIYIGVIPVFIGLLWLPFIRKLDPKRIGFFLSVTVGLLIFLGVDAIQEALEVSSEILAGSMNGPLLILVAASGAFLAIQSMSGRLNRANTPMMAAVLISVGIGLHNFGEGLALGAAINLGSVAFSASFDGGLCHTQHHRGGWPSYPTISRQKHILKKVIILGFVAGAPAILGTWTGGFVYSPIYSVAFLAVGAGAIFQVAITIMSWTLKDNKPNSYQVCVGIFLGMLIMYITGILA